MKNIRVLSFGFYPTTYLRNAAANTNAQNHPKTFTLSLISINLFQTLSSKICFTNSLVYTTKYSMHTIGNSMHTIGNTMHTISNCMHKIDEPMHIVINSMHTIGKPMHTIGNNMHTIVNSMYEIDKPMHTIVSSMHNAHKIQLKNYIEISTRLKQISATVETNKVFASIRYLSRYPHL